MTARIDPLSRYEVDLRSGCWIWTGPLNHKGYGQHGKRLAHGLVYETLRGPVAAGMQLDHLCRTRACVNPDHLEPVSPRENIMRSPIANAAVRASATHCESGHPFTGANLYVDPNGYRRCRSCIRRWAAESKERRRERERSNS